jgi:hypothetical protein
MTCALVKERCTGKPRERRKSSGSSPNIESASFDLPRLPTNKSTSASYDSKSAYPSLNITSASRLRRKTSMRGRIRRSHGRPSFFAAYIRQPWAERCAFDVAITISSRCCNCTRCQTSHPRCEPYLPGSCVMPVASHFQGCSEVNSQARHFKRHDN